MVFQLVFIRKIPDLCLSYKQTIKISLLASLLIIHIPAQIKWSFCCKADKKHHTHEQADVFKKWLSFLILSSLSREYHISKKHTKLHHWAHISTYTCFDWGFSKITMNEVVWHYCWFLAPREAVWQSSNCLKSVNSQDQVWQIFVLIIYFKTSQNELQYLVWYQADVFAISL